MADHTVLSTGDLIGVMAPSSAVEREDIERSAAFLEEQGYNAYIHPQTYARNNQSAGTHQDKIEALHELYRTPDIKAIWAAGGGNRALHICDALDYELIKANPKPLIGFSDVTALLNSIYAHCGIHNLHAPVFKHLHRHKHSTQTLELLSGNKDAQTLNLKKATVINDGYARGRIIGGNLSLFQYLPQTLPRDFWKGGILVLEDCNEELSRIDRMLLHLRRLGIFKEVSAVLFGEFTDLKESGAPFGFNLREIIEEHVNGLNIPIAINTPVGHGENLYPLWVGKEYDLKIADFTLHLYCP